MIPPDANAGFVAAMEDVLETYQKPRDPDRPLVCLDETSKQLVVETRTPIPAKPGQPARHRRCPRCGGQRPLKDRRPPQLRSLFGTVEVRTPRFEPCQCSVTVRRRVQ